MNEARIAVMEQIVGLVVAISLASWLYLILFRWSFWRADQRLNADLPAPDKWPEVVAVIPARDEADSIAPVLSSHASSTYEGKYSIVLVDDHSSDGTSAIAETVGGLSPIRDRRVRSCEVNT